MMQIICEIKPDLRYFSKSDVEWFYNELFIIG